MKTVQELELAIQTDSIYQQLLRDYQAAEEDYLIIHRSLPVEDRETLDRYISLGEEMDHRRIMLALSL